MLGTGRGHRRVELVERKKWVRLNPSRTVRPPGCTQKAKGTPGVLSMTSRGLKGPQKCLRAGGRARAHRGAGVGAGFSVLPPGHFEAVHKFGIEGLRGVEPGEAQDIGGVHHPIQVQNGQVPGGEDVLVKRGGHSQPRGGTENEVGDGCVGVHEDGGHFGHCGAP